MDSIRKDKPCRFGINCKYGMSCRFAHPQRQFDHFKQMNYQNYGTNDLMHQINCITLNDQIQMYLVNKPLASKKFQKADKPKYAKKQSSSEENSDGQTNSDQQLNPKQYKESFNPDQKFQEIRSLKVEDKIANKKKKKFLKVFQQTTVNSQVYDLYSQYLSEFFETRHIKQHKRQKIITFLAKQLSFQLEIVNYIISLVQQLEDQGFVQHFCYKRIIKTICKENFIIENIKAKLSKKLNVDQKRRKKNDNFDEKFPSPADVEFLESSDLIENESTNKGTIYLIDGNNCLTTQKHLRHHFRQESKKSKAEAQIRFRWLLSLVIQGPERCFIFFDDQFGDKIYGEIFDELMTGKEYKEMASSSTVIYAEKDEQADECIRRKLKQLRSKCSLDKNQVILITGDRVLVQQCYQINPLRRSSGSYLMKFVRKTVMREKDRPELKKSLKKILSYD